MKKVNFWRGNSQVLKKVNPRPNLRLPKPKLNGSKDLVKTGINTALALTALGVGVAAYRSLSEGS